MTFFVPGKLANPMNASGQGNWQAFARERKAWRGKTKMAALAVLGARSLRPVDVSQRRVFLTAHTWNEMDGDGLQAALKPVRDGLVDAGLILDDSPKSGNVFVYAQRIDRGRRGVWVTVEAL